MPDALCVQEFGLKVTFPVVSSIQQGPCDKCDLSHEYVRRQQDSGKPYILSVQCELRAASWSTSQPQEERICGGGGSGFPKLVEIALGAIGIHYVVVS
jgi:hypothetical protein